MTLSITKIIPSTEETPVYPTHTKLTLSRAKLFSHVPIRDGEEMLYNHLLYADVDGETVGRIKSALIRLGAQRGCWMYRHKEPVKPKTYRVRLKTRGTLPWRDDWDGPQVDLDALPDETVSLAAVLRLPHKEADRLVDNPLLQLRYITKDQGVWPCLTV